MVWLYKSCILLMSTSLSGRTLKSQWPFDRCVLPRGGTCTSGFDPSDFTKDEIEATKEAGEAAEQL